MRVRVSNHSVSLYYLLVPTRWLGAISMVSVAESWRTAKPRSAMQQVPFFFTKMFLDFRSLWAIAGLPAVKHKVRFRAHYIWGRNSKSAHWLGKNDEKVMQSCRQGRWKQKRRPWSSQRRLSESTTDLTLQWCSAVIKQKDLQQPANPTHLHTHTT